MPVQSPSNSHLQRSLKSRHLKMISLGGVIGAGLFVGSSAIIHDAGPELSSPIWSPGSSSCAS